VNASGTEQDPLINIRVAVGRALPGDTIVLFPGTYASRDIEVYDVNELHFRGLDPQNRFVLSTFAIFPLYLTKISLVQPARSSRDAHRR
jgi:hypothetical protein